MNHFTACSPQRGFGWPLALATAITLCNAFKPPCVDDHAYLAVARQIANNPLDPYGFEQFWYDRPQPANEVLAPPVLPYWLALGLRLLGDETGRLKCFLFPFAWLLTSSLDDILRRTTPRVAGPTLAALVLSPSILPAFNFMLDVPAWALSCTAIRLFLSAGRCGGLAAVRLAALSGLAAGLATQTKYTGLLTLAVILPTAIAARRLRLGAIAGGIAALMFLTWEAFTAARYGQSHFLIAWKNSETSWRDRLAWTVYGLRLLGGVGVPLVLVGMAAATRHRGVPLLIAALYFASLAGYAWSDDRRHSVWLPSEQQVGSGYGRWMLTVWGIAAVGTMAVAIGRLASREKHRFFRSHSGWMLWWLLAEIAGFFLMSPFPAARRVIGTVGVALLLLARSTTKKISPVTAWLAAILSTAAGCLFALTDLADAQLEPRAVQAAVAWIRAESATGRIWYVGHWGTQEAAERAGCEPWVPGRSHGQSGDWLLVPSVWVVQQRVDRFDTNWQLITIVSIDRRWPFRTLPPYYGGDQPIEVWQNPMIELRIYRAR